jgi:hypothetical protein
MAASPLALENLAAAETELSTLKILRRLLVYGFSRIDLSQDASTFLQHGLVCLQVRPVINNRMYERDSYMNGCSRFLAATFHNYIFWMGMGMGMDGACLVSFLTVVLVFSEPSALACPASGSFITPSFCDAECPQDRTGSIPLPPSPLLTHASCTCTRI